MKKTLLMMLLLFAAVAQAQNTPRKECGTAVCERIFGKPVRRAATRSTIGVMQKFTGERKGLIILMEFPNQKFITQNKMGKAIDPHEMWNDIANKEGLKVVNGVIVNGSVKDYFHDQSYGQFTLSFDVLGPYTAKNKYAYYGRNIQYANGEFDQHPDELIVEACTAASKEVNFKDYDWDDDGEVDHVYVVYAGYGEADTGDPETIWPHKSYLSVRRGDPLILQDMTIDVYACSNELNSDSRIDGMGSICHEFSHCLGLPDLYNTDTGLSVVGYYDLMDAGNYNGGSWYPAGYSSFERYFCGWIEPRPADGIDEVGDLRALHLYPDACIIQPFVGSTDYFLVENRVKESWDSFLPSHGMLAWHINYDLEVWKRNDTNNDPGNMGVVRVELSDVPTAILPPEGCDRQPEAWYDLNGCLLPAAPRQRGIYIIRYADGTTKKCIR